MKGKGSSLPDPANDIARLVCYLAGPDSDAITGQTLNLDNGSTLS